MTNDAETTEELAKFPPPPWRLHGQHWGALFRTDRPVDATEATALGAKTIFSKRLGVALLHYTSGTLSYDELIVSVPIRIGLRPYMWIRDIWVSDIQSQAGGIHIWNLPKQMAAFDWNEKTVTINDAIGLVARLRLNSAPTHWPWAFAIVPIAGSLNGTWQTATAKWRGRVSLSKPIVEEWSDRFSERLIPGRAIGFSSSRFLITIPAAVTAAKRSETNNR